MRSPNPNTNNFINDIAVTGATGFIGSALIKRLVNDCRSVTALTRNATPVGPARVHSVGNLECSTKLKGALAGADAVVHLAARVHMMAESAGEDTLALYRSVNVEGSRRVAEAAASAGVRRLVFLSSIKVLGEATFLTKPFTASDTPRPLDAYGQTKWEAEQVLWDVARETGLEVVVVRPPLVYGPGVKANFERLMKLVQRGVPLPLGGVRNRRSMVGLDNLVDLLIRCVDAPEAAGQTFLVSDGRDLSSPELIRLIAQAMGRSPRLLPVPKAILRLAGSITGKQAEMDRLCGSLQVDSSETRRVLQWEPPISVEEGIQRTVNAFAGSRC